MALKTFPVELLKLITITLSDKDLCNFTLVCKVFHEAVHGDQSVWRSRFLRVYDEPAEGKRGVYGWETTYQRRQRLLKGELKHTKFRGGETKEELEVLGVLRDMLLDAHGYSTIEKGVMYGRNFTQLCLVPVTRLLFNSYIYENPHPLLSTISLLLTPVLSPPEKKHLEILQRTVYAPEHNWIFNIDGTPNVCALDALAGLFAWHLHPESESHLFHQRTLLTPGEMPNLWEGNLRDDDAKIPSKWFGAYAYLGFHRIITYDLGEIFPETSDSHLVDMALTLTSPLGTKTTFTADGRDFKDFTIQSGEITAIPSPPELSAITGWKKVLFVKDYKSHRWFYEGVMLPGNNMILGHWRPRKEFVFPRGNSGPFCFWRAPESSSLRFRDNRVSLNTVGAV